jgi:ATP-dependent Clp protease protease subunit
MNTKTKLETINLDELLGNQAQLSPATYQYYKCLNERKIIINDEITSDIVENYILPLLEWDNDGTGNPIDIILNSCGGSVFDGLVLCNIIEKLKTPTTITVLGYAYSMAGLILLSGANNKNVFRKCYEFSTGLIHSGQSCLEGSTSIVKDTFKFQEKIDIKIKEFILTHSKITEEEYEKMERYEWYMTSDEMIRTGLIDEII